ncbi:MAG TPA: cell division protein FtsQ/DivIB [Geminicoccaceae bacterium]
MRRVSLAARRARSFLRRPPPPRWRRPAILAIGIGLTAMAAAGTLDWALRSGVLATTLSRVERGVLRWTVEAGLGVDQILLDGRIRTSRQAVLDHLGVHAGDPILGLAPEDLSARLEDLTWVESAEVVRLLPGTLHVRLSERRPLALWQKDGRLALIDHAGGVVPTGDGRDELLRAYGNLRIVVGDGAAGQAAKLFAALSSEPELWSKVVALTFVGGRRWDVRLDRGIDVLLPDRDPVAAWRRLARVAREHDLLERAVTEIDLRLLPDRMRLRLDRDAIDQGRTV